MLSWTLILLLFLPVDGQFSACRPMDWPEISSSSYPGIFKGGFLQDSAHEDCRNYCKNKRNPATTFYGIKRNTVSGDKVRCYCGDVLPPAEDNLCSYTCGASSKHCGGPGDSMSIFPVCSDGKFGLNCTRSCSGYSPNCKEGICHVTNTTCVLGCTSQDLYGDLCQTCPNNCINDCWKQGPLRCSRCDMGFFGLTCVQTCSSTCKYGCNQLTRKCYQCDTGYYGDECSRVCSSCKSGCSQTDGQCGTCIDGFYGPMCKDICNTCQGKCTMDGTCYYGCYPGYHGEKCDQRCPINCNQTCDKTTAVCNDKCQPGYKGPRCETRCPVNCMKHACDQDLGICTQGCVPGWHGDFCDMSCSRCVNHTCLSSNGTCQSGCVQGWYGTLCDQPCPVGCANNTCSDRNGECLNGCVQGFTGPTCEERCSDWCEEDLCDSEGDCTLGCSGTRYYGRKCDQPCSLQCTSGYCHGAGICIISDNNLPATNSGRKLSALPVWTVPVAVLTFQLTMLKIHQ